MLELFDVFQDVEDPRRSNATRHDLHEMLVVALLSMLTGGRTCVDMSDFGHAWEGVLREFMELGHGVPSHDAFPRLFRMLDPASPGTALRLAQDWADALGDVVAVDGKALRRSFGDAGARSPLHLVQAFAAEAKLTPGQVEVEDKSNGIPALPALLELIDVRGRTVTADAMHAQRGTAAAIVARGGDHALAPKGNQGTLHEDVKLYLDDPARREEFLSHQEVGKGHGRVERRGATVCHDVGWLLERHDWPGLAAIGKVTAERQVRNGGDSVDTRYHLLGAKLSAAVRARGAEPLEHRERRCSASDLHRVLDVTMDGDRARNRKGNGAHCLAVMRRLAPDIARLHPDDRSVRRKFLHASRKPDFLFEMIRMLRRRE